MKIFYTTQYPESQLPSAIPKTINVTAELLAEFKASVICQANMEGFARRILRRDEISDGVAITYTFPEFNQSSITQDELADIYATTLTGLLHIEDTTMLAELINISKTYRRNFDMKLLRTVCKDLVEPTSILIGSSTWSNLISNAEFCEEFTPNIIYEEVVRRSSKKK